MSQMIPFTFDAHNVRVQIDGAGDPWWVVADVCEVLGIENSRDAFSRISDAYKGVGKTDTLGGEQSLAIVNEPGLYELIFRSNKPEAKRFRHWVFTEVLPQIRKTGRYEVASAPLPEETAFRRLHAWMALAELCEAPKYIALIEGAKQVKKLDGIDLAPVLQISAALDAIPDEQMMLEPTEIGKRLGMSGADVNKRLQQAGMQARIDGEWRPTDAGKEQCYRHAWHVGEKSGFNLKWNVDFVQKCLTQG